MSNIVNINSRETSSSSAFPDPETLDQLPFIINSTIRHIISNNQPETVVQTTFDGEHEFAVYQTEDLNRLTIQEDNSAFRLEVCLLNALKGHFIIGLINSSAAFDRVYPMGDSGRAARVHSNYKNQKNVAFQSRNLSGYQQNLYSIAEILFNKANNPNLINDRSSFWNYETIYNKIVREL